MSKIQFKPIVISFVDGQRNVSYHANTVQELIDDMKQYHPELTFVQAKDNNKNNIRGVFVNQHAKMDTIDEDINNDNILDYFYSALMCDYDELATLDHYIV